MGINNQQADYLAGQRSRTRMEPNFTVVNKLMVNTRYVKLPNVVSLGQTPEAANRRVGEMRADWIEILLDAGTPLSDPWLPVNEVTHFIV